MLPFVVSVMFFSIASKIDYARVTPEFSRNDDRGPAHLEFYPLARCFVVELENVEALVAFDVNGNCKLLAVAVKTHNSNCFLTDRIGNF